MDSTHKEKYVEKMSSSNDGDDRGKSETGPWGKYSPVERINYFESMFVSKNPWIESDRMLY